MRPSLVALFLSFTLVAACSDDDGAGGGGSGPLGGDGGAGGEAATGGLGGAGGADATTVGGAGEGGVGGAPVEPFALVVSTELTGATLVLRCNLPRDVAGCVALEAPDAPCEDLDGDGLVDAWEAVVIDRLRPVVTLDEDEQFVNDPSAVVGVVARVAPVLDEVRAFLMIGYSMDYGSCGGFTSHPGDSERVALRLVAEPGRGPGDVRIASAYTASHEGTPNSHSRVFTGEELSELTFGDDPTLGEPRWIVFASADKHATYASKEICEGISFVPCLDEDCAPDGVADPTTYTILPPFVNAGEEAAPLVTELSALGFPGDDAWAAQDFCGGLGGTGCSAPVREKLLVDPF
jgi:hypothetical protein